MFQVWDSLAVCVFHENEKETAPISKWVLNRDQAYEWRKNSRTSKPSQTNSHSERIASPCTKPFVNFATFYILF